MLDLESFWADLLSGDPARVRAALDPLEREDRDAVMRHLERMATEEGWSESQRLRARAALGSIGPEARSRRQSER